MADRYKEGEETDRPSHRQTKSEEEREGERGTAKETGAERDN